MGDNEWKMCDIQSWPTIVTKVGGDEGGGQGGIMVYQLRARGLEPAGIHFLAG